MKVVNRKRGMIVCCIVMVWMLFESMTGRLFLYFDFVSLIFGLVVGWALRETLEPIHEGESEE